MTTRKKSSDPVMNHDPLQGMETSAEPADDRAGLNTTSPAVEATVLDAKENVVTLGESLTIQDVAGMLETLRRLLELGGTVTLNAGELDQVDGAGIQLLCTFVKEAVNQHIEVKWVATAEKLQSAAELLGLAEVLNLSIKQAA
ncbi:STAS domain-containing protein [endosymbiont of Lamellibrachia barhami]|uniref:STAS domain-containing protein n=1 Tax=endosymbiont of Lamellibrachia barhami TaxID=205975 RepID=UPI0015AC899E|nr:STAS domain-containing protein [endosymbiont of Lamellibrachia barhami]